MRRLPVLVLLLPVAVLVTAHNAALADHGQDDCMVDVSKARAQPKTALPAMNVGNPGEGVTVYLNRHRTTLNAGWDSSATDTSQLVYSRGQRSLTVPGFSGTDPSWDRIVSCVQTGMSAFNVTVVDQRPPSGDYVMAMVGGRSSLLGFRGSISGVAPYAGKLLPNAVLFVFARSSGNRVASVCQTALHEIGHSLGLDHTYYAPDTMSYLPTRGTKTFQDRAMACGEFSRRTCGNGARTQNSYQGLVSAVGLRDAGHGDADDTDDDTTDDTDDTDDTDAPTQPPPMTRPPAVTRPPAPEPPEDHVPIPRTPTRLPPAVTTRMPDVEILAPVVGDALMGDSDVHIIVRADAPRGVARVELAWAMGNTTHVLTCGAIPRTMPVTCLRDGKFYAFSLKVGVGQRAFSIRVTDAAGNQTTTQPRTLHFPSATAPQDWDVDDDD